ncbi:MAG: hypothetical protein R6W77_06885 [Trueperaceae bacterium]
MWLPRIVAALRETERPVVLTGGEPFGTPFVIDALRQAERTAWFSVNAQRRDDPVAVGNALARAVNAVLPGALLTPALPYTAHLKILNRFRTDVAPLRLVLSIDDLPSAVATDVMALHGDGLHVVLDVREPKRVDFTGDWCVIGPGELRVRPDEARAIAPGSLTEADVAAMLTATDGRFTEFAGRAQAAANLPRMRVPTPTGYEVDVHDAVAVEPAIAVQALRREGDVVDALELAVLRAPELVEDVLRSAGPRYQEEGLLKRLHLLLSALPEAHARSERVLEWRLLSALAAGDMGAVIDDVDEHLRTHRAPSLRARRAGTLPRAEGFAMAEQAVAERRTALTTWQYGRLHPNPEAAIEVLRESVRLAEDGGSSYEVARNADTLSARLYQAGQFANAATWARWALDVFDRDQLQDGARRLLLLNDLAVARIMAGDLVGLRSTLESAQAMVDGAVPELAVLLSSTLAQLDLAERRTKDAIDRFRATYHASTRRTRARYGYQLVRALVEDDRIDEARQVAADVTVIADAGPPHEASLAALARGIVAAVAGADHEPAKADLARAMLDESLAFEPRLSAALYYLAASPGSGHDVPAGLTTTLRTLPATAVQVLAGPGRVLRDVWQVLSNPQPTLALRFLGGVECRLDGRLVPLSERLAEAALVLALHPGGITREALVVELTPDGKPPYSNSGIRALLTRLRVVLPVSEAPYRIAVPYRADVLEVRERLAAGRVREAVAMMRGLLLPSSDAPGIVEQRWALEEEVRQAALSTLDADVLFDLAERTGDDLEYWQAAVEALPDGDPRTALAKARVRRLERSYGVESRTTSGS